ncbi:MAG: sulfite exporter TauE/SafE family protein [Alphaproteobacteria bacterium]|nr:sulfite exporter TauE/SafE family protein [Alphaproteobacteria bacterium]MBV9419975.1 sulfite exporter TauE/SafE family protein [Alphaproteobacteria bacterium]MBV9542164.1 sulfite exporter TauE/SafE family protein [Alphaproteobacteria bacterium]MBV9905295.1 sulfite exporter TauE/SafE family protein [Alphaproteobacteria bacterium]
MDFLTAASGGELGTFALGLVLSGIVGGLVAGMLGVGGGIVIVPVLYHVMDLMGIDPGVRMHIAVGTSLATIIPTSFSSTRSHDKKGAVDWALLRRWVAPMVVGVIIGSVLAGIARGQALALFFACVALPVAVHLAFFGENRRLSDHLPTGIGGLLLPAGIGGVSTMMGIGGGTVGVPAMTLCGVPIHRAVGTAAAFGAIISIPGTIGAIIGGWGAPHLPPYSLGYVNLLGFVLIAPASYFVAPFGAQIAHNMDRTKLRRMFAFFIGLTAARMLYDALGLHWF